MWISKMHENTDFHHNFQLRLLCRNDDCSIAVFKRAVRNNMHCLSTINGNYGAMQHSSLQSINLRCVFVLSYGFLGGLCLHCPSAYNLFSVASLNSPLYLWVHPKLQPASKQESSRDVDTQDTEVPKRPFVASSFCLCWETALSGKLGSCRAAWTVSRAAQPAAKSQSRCSHSKYRGAQKPGG